VLTVHEIYLSIQGESTHAGRPCTFVRLTACDLRCRWCDTPYAFTGGRKMPLAEVVAAVEAQGCRLVELTGGEPLLQPEAPALMGELVARGYEVLLETGGHVPTGVVPAGVVTILDVKCPGSGEADKNDWDNLGRLAPQDEVKFVIQDRADYDFSKDVIDRYGLAARAAAILLSPVHGVLEPRVLSEWMLADRLPARLQLQLHKYIWSPSTRGV
jgi:7-carboxy-7-deazaguanine synthase